MVVIAIGVVFVVGLVAYQWHQARQPLDLGAKEWRTADERDAAIAETDARWRVPTRQAIRDGRRGLARVGGVTTRELERQRDAAIVAAREARIARVPARVRRFPRRVG